MNYFLTPSLIQLHRGKYKTKKSISNVIRYITRTRPNEDRAYELVLYGTNHGYHYQKTPEQIITEFEFVQKYTYTTGSRLCHYIIQISPDYFNETLNGDIYALADTTVQCCNYVFGLGHQTCFAIHNVPTKDGLHIHLVINTINFITGKKLNQYPRDIYNTIEKPLSEILMFPNTSICSNGDISLYGL